MENIKIKNHIFDLLKKKQEWLDSFPVLSEQDFYPPEDKRVLHSRVYDIPDGDNFDDFMQQYNELCDEEEIYDDCGSNA